MKGCCKAMVKRLVPMFVSTPNTTEEWLRISEVFEKRWNYPHALGAIDGKHVTIRKPDYCGSFYYNYKHTHSVILMAIAGLSYECMYADVGSNGQANDSSVWNKSSLLEAINDNSVGIPEDDNLPNGIRSPYVFLGDDPFALKSFMMKPYPKQNLTVVKRIYNYRPFWHISQ